MDSILQGLDGVFCYLDDILITGATTEEHLTNLENVLKRLQGCGLQLWEENCHFLKESVEYLSHKVDAEGLHDNESKLQVITHVPPPQNLQELHSFLGLLNCYGCFIYPQPLFNSTLCMHYFIRTLNGSLCLMHPE